MPKTKIFSIYQKLQNFYFIVNAKNMRQSSVKHENDYAQASIASTAKSSYEEIEFD